MPQNLLGDISNQIEEAYKRTSVSTKINATKEVMTSKTQCEQVAVSKATTNYQETSSEQNYQSTATNLNKTNLLCQSMEIGDNTESYIAMDENTILQTTGCNMTLNYSVLPAAEATFCHDASSIECGPASNTANLSQLIKNEMKKGTSNMTFEVINVTQQKSEIFEPNLTENLTMPNMLKFQQQQELKQVNTNVTINVLSSTIANLTEPHLLTNETLSISKIEQRLALEKSLPQNETDKDFKVPSQNMTYTINQPPASVQDLTYSVNQAPAQMQDLSCSVNQPAASVQDVTYSINQSAPPIQDSTYSVANKPQQLQQHKQEKQSEKLASIETEKECENVVANVSSLNLNHNNREMTSNLRDILNASTTLNNLSTLYQNNLMAQNNHPHPLNLTVDLSSVSMLEIAKAQIFSINGLNTANQANMVESLKDELSNQLIKMKNLKAKLKELSKLKRVQLDESHQKVKKNEQELASVRKRFNELSDKAMKIKSNMATNTKQPIDLFGSQQLANLDKYQAELKTILSKNANIDK